VLEKLCFRYSFSQGMTTRIAERPVPVLIALDKVLLKGICFPIDTCVCALVFGETTVSIAQLVMVERSVR